MTSDAFNLVKALLLLLFDLLLFRLRYRIKMFDLLHDQHLLLLLFLAACVALFPSLSQRFILIESKVIFFLLVVLVKSRLG